MHLRMLLTVVSLNLVLSAAASAGVTIDYVQTYSNVSLYDYDISNVVNHAADGYSLTGDVVSVTAGPYTSTVSSMPTSTSLFARFIQTGAGDPNDFVSGHVVVGITATTDMPYLFSGRLTGLGSYTEFQGYLLDTTTNTLLFHNIQASSEPATFSMGLEDGSYSNLLEGSLAGMLQAGHSYYWSTAFRIDPSYDSIHGLGSGYGELLFHEVPEPSSLILLGGGFGAIGLFGRCRQGLQVAKRAGLFQSLIGRGARGTDIFRS